MEIALNTPPVKYPHPHVKSRVSNFIFVICQNLPAAVQKCRKALNTPPPLLRAQNHPIVWRGVLSELHYSSIL